MPRQQEPASREPAQQEPAPGEPGQQKPAPGTPGRRDAAPGRLAQREAVIWMRPAQALVGRPAERSRAEITAAAVALADQEGLDAVSMRRVAAALETGAASLYRYVSTRDELLDLMIDSTAGEYDLPSPTGDWQADLLVIARQARKIMRRHPWLPALVITRPTLGPHGVDLLEHALDALADCPASAAAKLEAFALMTALTALFVQNELAAADRASQRQAAYLQHVAAAGTHPRLTALMASVTPSSNVAPDDATLAGSTRADTIPADAARDQFEAVLRRTLAGLLS